MRQRRDKDLGYINSDLTVHLHRNPEGETIGLETVKHHRQGAIGTACVAALA